MEGGSLGNQASVSSPHEATSSQGWAPGKDLSQSGLHLCPGNFAKHRPFAG